MGTACAAPITRQRLAQHQPSRTPAPAPPVKRLSCFGGSATCRLVCLRVASGLPFGACAVADSFLLFEDGALFGRCLAAEADGVVVVAVGVGEIAAGAVVGVALGVFLV